jgi:hypothetical protein
MHDRASVTSLVENALGAAIVSHLAREVARLVGPPWVVQASGMSIVLLGTEKGRPVITASVVFPSDFASSRDSMPGWVERKIEELQDDISMHIRQRWPIDSGQGGRPEARLDERVLKVSFTEGSERVDFADYRFDIPPRAGG